MRAPTQATPEGRTPARMVQKPSTNDSVLLVLQSRCSARLLYLKTPKNCRGEFSDSPWAAASLASLDFEAMGRVRSLPGIGPQAQSWGYGIFTCACPPTSPADVGR